MLNIKDKTSVVLWVIGKNKHKTHIALRMILYIKQSPTHLI